MIQHTTNTNKATAQRWGDLAKHALDEAITQQPIDTNRAALWTNITYDAARRAAHAARGVIYTDFVNGRAVQRSA